MSKVNYDAILVVDFEATCDGCVECFKTKCSCSGEERTVIFDEREIIEIGICSLNVKSLTIKDEMSILVKPYKAEPLTEYCKKLTGITDEMIQKDGVTLEQACDKLRREFKSHKKPWASFGDWDRRQIEEETIVNEIRNPFTTRHVNIKTLLPIITNAPAELNLVQALDYLNYDFEGTQHRALNDAKMAARVLARLIRGGNFV